MRPTKYLGKKNQEGERQTIAEVVPPASIRRAREPEDEIKGMSSVDSLFRSLEENKDDFAGVAADANLNKFLQRKWRRRARGRQGDPDAGDPG